MMISDTKPASTLVDKEATSTLVDKEGWMKKRIGRMHRWTNRYFTLVGANISYKVKIDTEKVKDSFDLVPGCIVTEVHEEKIRGHSGKSYGFWIVWPHDKHDKSEERSFDGEESEEEGDPVDEKPNLKEKQLKEIVQKEMHMEKKHKKLIEEQIELHDAHDKTMSFGAKVGAAAAGAVVVGVLTAGIGLVPYAVGVGVAAAASGGAIAFQYRRPADSRLILACDTMHEAVAWKVAIEQQIASLETKPTLPVFADPEVIMNILDISKGSAQWRRRKIVEGMSIMELGPMPNVQTRCMKAQVTLHSYPLSAFLAMMDKEFWPLQGSLKCLKVTDDHTDILGIEVNTDCARFRGPSAVRRRLCLSRFWRTDDDGVYMITFNSAKHESYKYTTTVEKIQRGSSKEEGMGSPRNGTGSEEEKVSSSSSFQDKHQVNLEEATNSACSSEGQPSIDAVFTICPRSDHAEYDEDVMECLVTCILQVSIEDNWKKGELYAFMEDFLTQNLLELRYHLAMGRYFDCSTYDERDKDAGSNTTVQSNQPDNGSSKGHAVHQPDLYIFKDRERWPDKDHRFESAPGSSKASNKGDVSPREIKDKRNRDSLGSVLDSKGIATVQSGQDDTRSVHQLLRTRSDEGKKTSSQFSRRKSFAYGSKQEAPVPRRRLSFFNKKDQSEPCRALSRDSNDDSEHNIPPCIPKTVESLVYHEDHTSGASGASGEVDAQSGVKDRAVKSSGPRRYGIRGRTRQRSAAINSEASTLRGQIATKEYELKRMMKIQTQRKNITGPAHVDAVAQLTADLTQLKIRYQSLTGVSYEHRRKLLGGWTSRQNPIQNSTATQNMKPQPSNSGSAENTQLPASPRLKNNAAENDLSDRHTATSLMRALQQQQQMNNESRQPPGAFGEVPCPSASGSQVPHFWLVPTRQLRCDVSSSDLDIAFAHKSKPMPTPQSHSKYVEGNGSGSEPAAEYADLRPRPVPALTFPSSGELRRYHHGDEQATVMTAGIGIDAFGVLGLLAGVPAPRDDGAKKDAVASIGIILWFALMLWASTDGCALVHRWISE